MEPSVVFNIQPGPYWDWRIALDLFFGGAGVGAFVFAVGMDTAFKGVYHRITQTAAYLAPLFVILGLTLLLAKLGRPFQLFQTFFNFAPTAPLWWGGIFQTTFVIGSFWYALKWRRMDPDPGRRTLGWLLVPFALIVGAYHGLLLAVVTAKPLWNTGPTVVAALLGFVVTGIAAVMLVHLVRMRVAGRLRTGEHLDRFLNDLGPVRNILGAALVLQLGTCFLWWLSLNFGSLQDQQALAAANARYGFMFWWLGIGLGLLLPLALGGYAFLRGEATHRKLQVNVILLTSVLILVGGFFFRLAVVLGGQVDLPVPSLS
ncbi:MAG: NrfD/PsrC family molybdoenzyme membrane anchor subunit [Thermoanaerobaculia bacterium]